MSASGPCGEHAGVRNQQVNPAEPLQRERHRRVAGRAIGRIGRRKIAPVSRSSAAPRVLVAAAEDDVVAVRAQPADDRRADSAGAAGDERRAAHRARPASTVLARSAARMPPSISRSAPVIVRASSPRGTRRPPRRRERARAGRAAGASNADVSGRRLAAVDGRDHARLRVARADRVDAHAVRAGLHGEHAREHDQRRASRPNMRRSASRPTRPRRRRPGRSSRCVSRSAGSTARA